MEKQRKIERALLIFKEHSGLMRTSVAESLGVYKRTIYAMRDSGHLTEVARGWYRLSSLPALSSPDLAAVGLRVPQGIICLVSALSFHGLTTEIPTAIYLAIEKGAEAPQISVPTVRLFHISGLSFSEGIERHKISGIDVKIYCAEKTLADCFKFRNKIGLDTAIEALKMYRSKQAFDMEKILFFARICRVENIMKPYLESII